jgi:hypothetical protein
MRALSRPMFNMGGPIKQGVMHGIREPKKHGGSMSESQGKNLVGDPVYPKTDGRAHHALFGGAGIATIAGLSRLAPWAMRTGARYLPKIKSIFGTTTPASVTRGVSKTIGPMNYRPVTINPAKFNPNWLGRDPLVRGVGWAGKSIFNPTVGGWAAKGLRMATSPSSIIAGVAYYMWPDGTEKTTPPPTGIMKPGGFPGDAVISEKKELSDSAKKAFANKQRNERVQKYLDLMGYDRSKKTAIADALIDASKIVGDRGTLKGKNITQELINPIIQATSKRLDKPDQIREAVGLMATKAEIEKDLSAETDALAKEKTIKQIAALDRQLEQGFEADIRNLLLTARTPPNKTQLEQYARLTADKYGETFTKVEGEGDIAGDGIYMVEGTLVRVKDGTPKRIV